MAQQLTWAMKVRASGAARKSGAGCAPATVAVSASGRKVEPERK